MDDDGKLKRWLVRIGLGQYADKFVEQNIDFADVRDLSDGDLAELGVSIGHRKKFHRALGLSGPDTAAESGAGKSAATGFHDAERRQITVLFADLVGSTAWSTRLDPEDMRDIIRAYQEACAREIRQFEGFIARYAGDGILAYFGYPVSHENDPGLCVRAALGIVGSMDGLNQWVAPEHHARLEVRIGIATGVVVIGDLIGDGTVEQRSVVGETPNLAARLQSLAEPDTIVVAPSTRLLLGGLFQLKSLGDHRLKGIADAIEAWQVLGTEAPESRFVASHATELTTLVGRSPEMEALLRCWKEVKSGTPRLVLISGEPGVGKSRLVQEFRQRLADEPHNCLVIQCWSHTQNSALLPIIEMIQRVLRFTQDDDNEARLAKLETSLAEIGHPDPGLTPLLASLLEIDVGDRYPPLRLSADAQKRETFIALAKVFGALSAREPTLVVIEDIHWIDPSTREFVSFLWPNMDKQRLMLLASIRTGHLDRWPLQEETQPMELRPISADDARTLISNIAGHPVLPDALVKSIVHRTDGVPLYVEELTRLVMAGEGDESNNPEAIPSSLHDLLLARFAQLTWEHEVAMLCAVLGRRFDDSLIEAVWRGETTDLKEGLARLVHVGILSRRQAGNTTFFTFRHVLIQEAAYSSLLRSDRSALHQNIADVLEKRYTGGTLIQPEVLADHFEKSGNPVKAIEYLLMAGQNCSKRSANLEAISHLNKALDLVAELPDSGAKLQLELSALVAISSPLVRTRGYAAPEAEKTLVRARELCSQLGDSPQLIAVLCGLSIFSQARGDLGQARELAEHAQVLSERANDNTLRLLSCRSLGGAAFWLGDLELARQHLQQGVELYDPGTHGALAYVYFVDPGVVCHSTLALDLWTLGYPDQAMSHATESVKLAEAIYHPYSVGFAKLYLATLNQVRQEAELARDYAAEVVKLSEAQVLPQGVAWGNVLLGWATSKLGDPAQGDILISKGIQLWRKIGTRLILPYFLALFSDACLKSSRNHDGLDAIEEALNLAGKTGERCWQAELYRLRGEHRLVQYSNGTSTGDSVLIDIESDYRLALADANKRRAKSLELRSACSLAQFLRLQGRSGEAEDLLSGHCLQWDDDVVSADLDEAQSLLKSL